VIISEAIKLHLQDVDAEARVELQLEKTHLGITPPQLSLLFALDFMW
jgi:hypothetical protein